MCLTSRGQNSDLYASKESGTKGHSQGTRASVKWLGEADGR